jgi:hypothetical protein
MRDASDQESKWLRSMQTLLNKRPAGTFLFAEGTDLHLYDEIEWDKHASIGEDPGSLESLGSASVGKNFDCGGF